MKSYSAGRSAGRSVVALAGRRIDAPGGDPPRFPLDMAERVRDRVRDVLLGEAAITLVSSAACGADLLALDAAAQLGLRRRIVLPLPVARFRKVSVVDRPGDWGPLFDRCIDDARTAADLVVLDCQDATMDAAFSTANERILQEAAALAVAPGATSTAAPGAPITAAQDTPPGVPPMAVRVVAVLVWDGEPRGADDHTAAFGRLARERGLAVIEIPTHE